MWLQGQVSPDDAQKLFRTLHLIETESFLLAAAGPEHTPGAYPWDDSEYHKCVQAADGVAIEMPKGLAFTVLLLFVFVPQGGVCQGTIRSSCH